MPSNTFIVKPSRYDPRDYIYKSQQGDLRDEVDLTQWDTRAEAQGAVGSCVGAAIVGAYESILKRTYSIKNTPEKFVDLSKLYAYYHARLLDGVENEDSGATIKNGLRAVQKFGICPESLWPYNEDLWAVQPNLECYVQGWPYKKIVYQTLYSIGDMLSVLNSENHVIIGINVFDNFRNLNFENATVTEPTDATGEYGGHAMKLSGYSIPNRYFLAKNSYSSSWGKNGFCYIPFDYMNQWCFDRWTFTTIEE